MLSPSILTRWQVKASFLVFVCDSCKGIYILQYWKQTYSGKRCLSKYMRTQEQTRMHIGKHWVFVFWEDEWPARKGGGVKISTRTHPPTQLKAYSASFSLHWSRSKWWRRNPEYFSLTSLNLAMVRSVNPKINMSGLFLVNFSKKQTYAHMIWETKM